MSVNANLIFLRSDLRFLSYRAVALPSFFNFLFRVKSVLVRLLGHLLCKMRRRNGPSNDESKRLTEKKKQEKERERRNGKISKIKPSSYRRRRRIRFSSVYGDELHT